MFNNKVWVHIFVICLIILKVQTSNKEFKDNYIRKHFFRGTKYVSPYWISFILKIRKILPSLLLGRQSEKKGTHWYFQCFEWNMLYIVQNSSCHKAIVKICKSDQNSFKNLEYHFIIDSSLIYMHKDRSVIWRIKFWIHALRSIINFG